VTELEALSAALAVENEVIYGYGALGPRLGKEPRRYALATLDVHRARRDQLQRLIQSHGGSPAPAAPSYQTPRISGERDATTLAAKLEDGCAGASWDLIASTAAATPARTMAVGWLSDAAVRAAHWRSTTQQDPVFPGKPG
jgi:hypothetical protein